MTSSETRCTPLEYAVYGAVCAAKRETGPAGARCMYRIQERIKNWDDEAVGRALIRLADLGWITELPADEFGFVYYGMLDP